MEPINWNNKWKILSLQPDEAKIGNEHMCYSSYKVIGSCIPCKEFIVITLELIDTLSAVELTVLSNIASIELWSVAEKKDVTYKQE